MEKEGEISIDWWTKRRSKQMIWLKWHTINSKPDEETIFWYMLEHKHETKNSCWQDRLDATTLSMQGDGWWLCYVTLKPVGDMEQHLYTTVATFWNMDGGWSLGQMYELRFLFFSFSFLCPDMMMMMMMMIMIMIVIMKIMMMRKNFENHDIDKIQKLNKNTHY